MVLCTLGLLGYEAILLHNLSSYQLVFKCLKVALNLLLTFKFPKLDSWQPTCENIFSFPANTLIIQQKFSFCCGFVIFLAFFTKLQTRNESTEVDFPSFGSKERFYYNIFFVFANVSRLFSSLQIDRTLMLAHLCLFSFGKSFSFVNLWMPNFSVAIISLCVVEHLLTAINLSKLCNIKFYVALSFWTLCLPQYVA